MKNNSFKENFSPIIVLVVICLVTTLALAGTYSVANPKIIETQKAAADEARGLVLPEGDSTTESWSTASSTATWPITAPE